MIVPDLFFATRIDEAARAAGVAVIQCPAGHALEVCRTESPDLIIVDLHGRDDPLGIVRALKADPAVRAVPIAGFYAHVDQETRRAAEAAGVDLVLPRSAFTARLGELLAGLPFPPNG
jgi:CheY-like chemotaxis protein